MKNLLLIVSVIYSFNVNAKCLKDIFMAGVGGTSSEFKLSESTGDSNVNTTAGLNLLGSWLLFCPQQRVEIVNQIEFRNYKFDKKNGLDKSVSLLGLSSNGSYIYKSRIELIGKVTLEQDLFFKRFNDGKINYKKNFTSNFLAGAKYNAVKINKSDIYIHLLIGPRFSFSDYSEGIGLAYEIGFSTIYKIAKMKSISLNLYYRNITQSMIGLDQSNKDLTLNTSYVFKF